ncbi:hypothetical protein SESBI_14594 [Sesbania bispinosa]|nr:hypothetical protein SESBI_14594 [Sesbania bispinosa]
MGPRWRMSWAKWPKVSIEMGTRTQDEHVMGIKTQSECVTGTWPKMEGVMGKVAQSSTKMGSRTLGE